MVSRFRETYVCSTLLSSGWLGLILESVLSLGSDAARGHDHRQRKPQVPGPGEKLVKESRIFFGRKRVWESRRTIFPLQTVNSC